MKEAILIIIDMLYDSMEKKPSGTPSGEAVKEVLSFIDEKTGRSADDVSEITGQFPIFFLNGAASGHSMKEEFEPYVSEEMNFIRSSEDLSRCPDALQARNVAGQSLEEVLGILDIRNLYLCGECGNIADELKQAGYSVTILSEKHSK